MNKNRRTSYYAYIRVSITAGSETDSIKERQEKTIREWIANKGDDHLLVMLECDTGYSSILKLSERTGLRRVLHQIHRDSVFLAYSVTDVGRTFVEFFNIEEEVRERGGYFISIFEGYNTNKADGLMQMQMSCSHNRYSKIQKSKCVDYECKLEDIPYGWDNFETGRIYENWEEQEVITLIKQLCQGNDAVDYNRISDYLNGTSINAPGGAGWTPECLKKVLSEAQFIATLSLK